MEKQAVVSILEFYKNIDEEIRLNKAAITDLEERYYSSNSGINYDGMPKGKGGTSNPTESTALNVPDWVSAELQELQREKAALCRVRAAIRKELNRLPYIQRAVISSFYLEGQQWVRISAQIHYSERQCKNIRDCAIDKLGRRFSSNRAVSGYSFPQ